MGGLGRGAGNCPMELLIGFLRNPKFKHSPHLPLRPGTSPAAEPPAGMGPVGAVQHHRAAQRASPQRHRRPQRRPARRLPGLLRQAGQRPGHVMCGRFTLRTPAAAVAKQFGLLEVPPFEPRFNVAPSQPAAVVRLRRRAGAAAAMGLAPLGPGAQLGRRPGDRQPPDQRPGGDGRREAGLSRGLAAPPLPGGGRRLLRMATCRRAQATLFLPPSRPAALWLCRPLGIVARARRAAARVLHRADHGGQRPGPADPRPHAGDRCPGRLCAVARSGGGGAAAVGPAVDALSGRDDDGLSGQHADQQSDQRRPAVHRAGVAAYWRR